MIIESGHKKRAAFSTKSSPFIFLSAILLAGRPGFEPGLTESESVVLPLDDLPKFFLFII